MGVPNSGTNLWIISNSCFSQGVLILCILWNGYALLVQLYGWHPPLLGDGPYKFKNIFSNLYVDVMGIIIPLLYYLVQVVMWVWNLSMQMCSSRSLITISNNQPVSWLIALMFCCSTPMNRYMFDRHCRSLMCWLHQQN